LFTKVYGRGISAQRRVEKKNLEKRRIWKRNWSGSTSANGLKEKEKRNCYPYDSSAKKKSYGGEVRKEILHGYFGTSGLIVGAVKRPDKVGGKREKNLRSMVGGLRAWSGLTG